MVLWFSRQCNVDVRLVLRCERLKGSHRIRDTLRGYQKYPKNYFKNNAWANDQYCGAD
jgi:hypothetical protein